MGLPKISRGEMGRPKISRGGMPIGLPNIWAWGGGNGTAQTFWAWGGGNGTAQIFWAWGGGNGAAQNLGLPKKTPLKQGLGEPRCAQKGGVIYPFNDVTERPKSVGKPDFGKAFFKMGSLLNKKHAGYPQIWPFNDVTYGPKRGG